MKENRGKKLENKLSFSVDKLPLRGAMLQAIDGILC